MGTLGAMMAWERFSQLLTIFHAVVAEQHFKINAVLVILMQVAKEGV